MEKITTTTAEEYQDVNEKLKVLKNKINELVQEHNKAEQEKWGVHNGYGTNIE